MELKVKAKPKKLLLVVDMQNWFIAVQPNVILQVKKAIASFKKQSVVFIEYDGYGETLTELLSMVKKPEIIKKSAVGGSEVVEKWIAENGVPSEIHVCGIETCKCVAETVNPLVKKYDIKVIKAAVDCACSVHKSSCLHKIDAKTV